jgi:alkylhydroperoxidase/carboxymuconolactone decarboxylase family protein YurZ
MAGDAFWYEAAMVVGITNALNVVADGLGALMAPVKPGAGPAEVAAVYDEIQAFYGGTTDIPAPFGLAAQDPGYLRDLWGAVKRAFSDNALSRRLKTSLAFAVSLTTRSTFGTSFHLAEMRRLGVGEAGIMEVVGVTQMFSSYTKIADTLQLEPDMGDIAPADRTPAPGGERP